MPSPTVQAEAWLSLGLWCDKKRVHGKVFSFLQVPEITGKTVSATSPRPPSLVNQTWMKGYKEWTKWTLALVIIILTRRHQVAKELGTVKFARGKMDDGEWAFRFRHFPR